MDMDIQEISIATRSGPVELAYRDRGRGEPLLLLHGFFGTGGDFRHLSGLDAGMRSIVPDLRGHGRSTNPAERFAFHDAALDVVELLARLGVERCRAVGLSGGALTLLRLALLHPQLIDSMVLVSACDGFARRARRFMATFVSEAERNGNELRAQHAHGDPQIGKLLRSARGFAAGEDDARVSRAELGGIRARTLIVTGDCDPLYPLAVARRLSVCIPGAVLWVLEGEGHTPVFGRAREQFIARANAFLRE